MARRIGANHRDAANDRMLRCGKVGKATIPHFRELQDRLIALEDKLLTRKRSIIEMIADKLKDISQIAHTRQRSIRNFVVNLLDGLIAYTGQSKKAALHLSDRDLGPHAVTDSTPNWGYYVFSRQAPNGFLPAPFFYGRNPILKRFNILFEFNRLWNILLRCRRLIVPCKPFRGFRHGYLDRVAIL